MKKIIVLLSIVFTSFFSSAQCVSTIAGSGISGYIDGSYSTAQFKYPSGVDMDSFGNLYVADTGNNCIRKITPLGLVTTFAGSGIEGFADGTGNLAQFKSPIGLAVDTSGNIYVSDSGNSRIRKITSSGVVTTLAGSGIQGFANGLGNLAIFNFPHRLAIDNSGYIYVADAGNNRIRKISPNGLVTTLAGSGTEGYVDGAGTSAQFNFPIGVALDNLGNIFVADKGNYSIRKISASGNVSTIAGSGISGYAEGIGTEAKFQNPCGLDVDNQGNLYVSDFFRIRKISPLGVVTSLAGSGTPGYADGNAITAMFDWSNDVLFKSNKLYLTDSHNHRVRKITSTTVNIVYNNSPFCKSVTAVQSTTTGIGDYTGGTYTSSTGLSIDVITGAINPSLSTAGTYTVTYTTPATGGCAAVATTTSVVVLPAPTASISADGIIATSTTITNGSSVQLQLNGTLNAQPNIQWTPATAISSANVANPLVYPSATTTYTASFINSNGCTQTTSFTVNVTPQPNIGNLNLSSSNTNVNLFDVITVNVQLTNATNLYSLYMKLKGNAAVSQYLNYTGHTAGTLLGTGGTVISTPPTVTNGVPDFGITKVGAVPGYSGSGLFYSFTFVPKNIVIPVGTTFCFYLDDVSAYNATGTSCGLTNQGQLCYTFTNQVAVWPGDLNNNKSVTTADLLPIGYFYNSTGPVRSDRSISWSVHPATLWGYNNSSTSGDAYKVFADSNGDGVITNGDQAAIGFNMNQVRARMASPAVSEAPPHFTAQQLTTAAGTLTVTPNNTIINGATLPQSVTFTVNLNNTGGLSSLYGISVNLVFDETVFDLSTETIDYAGSIFGNVGLDCLALDNTPYNSSTNLVSAGLTRFGNAPINGQGLLFKVTIQTKSTLPNVAITPVTAYVDAANNQAGDTLVVQDAPANNLTIINNLGTNTVKQDEFVLYPNPASDVVYLQMGANTQLAGMKVKVVNLLGQIIEEQPIQNTTTELSTKNWGAAGVYFVQITNQNNTTSITKKVIVERK